MSLGSQGLGGVAATTEFVVVSDRALEDTTDLYRCLRAETGEEVWQFTNPALGQLDYGNSPRTTPLIVDGLVFLQGAFGQLHCLELATGNLVWQIDLIAEFGVDPVPTWGTCSSPLFANGKLIVNPGAAAASLVALNPKSGDVIWRTAGAAAGYGSLIVARLGGRLQVVGHDTDSLGGWGVEDGRRLWQLKPPIPRDFNVPTPAVAGEHLVVCTENNGTRLFRFREQGVIDPQPVATYGDLAPDTQSPVVVGRRLFGGGAGLHCLDLDQQLKPRWTTLDDPYLAHVNILASDERLLITTLEGELLLIDARSDRYSLLSRVSVLSGEAGVYAHPALVGSRLYLRGNSSLVCLDLGE